MKEHRDRLKDIIKEVSYNYSEDPVFKLVSGALSCFYFNLKKTTMMPEGLHLIGTLVYEKIQELGLDAKGIGGLTLGADPIAYAASMYSYLQGRELFAFVVRKAAKEHGMRLPVEGLLQAGDKVIVVDDVVTTGGSTIKAIRAAEEFGLKIQAVFVLVDRGEFEGIENIRQCGYPVFSFFNIKDFKS